MKESRNTCTNVLFNMLTMNGQEFFTNSNLILDYLLNKKSKKFSISALQKIVSATYYYHVKKISFYFLDRKKLYSKQEIENTQHVTVYKSNNWILTSDVDVETNELICKFYIS